VDTGVRKHREDGMRYYAGLDVGLRTVALCIIDETGEIRLERSLPSEVMISSIAFVASAKRSPASGWKPAV